MTVRSLARARLAEPLRSPTSESLRRRVLDHERDAKLASFRAARTVPEFEAHRRAFPISIPRPGEPFTAEPGLNAATEPQLVPQRSASAGSGTPGQRAGAGKS